jgi:tetratricopeptide (TPR) repeat protein
MEYIQGTPIIEYCEQHSLSLSDRLQLFRTVCSAVQYAHQNLVVHRDLKPSNILVTEGGIPKLLDFGIAKLLEPDAEVTITSTRLMTPECASPEQVRGESITTATDIYALGVLLYQLLTGERPYAFTTRTPEEVAHVICETEPKKPSALRPLSEDLDNIVLKAMHKEPGRRYVSAEQLSEDIRRYLAGWPVTARRDTFGYRAAKFIRRHRTASLAAILIGLSLVAGMGATMWEAHVARLERDRAERRFTDMRQLAGSVIFDLQNRLARLPGTTEVRKQLVGTALGYLDQLAKEPYGDAGLQKELAEAYLRIGDIQGGGNQNLGDRPGANESFGKAERIARKMLADTGSLEARMLLVDVLDRDASNYLRRGDRAEAEVRAKEELQMARDLARSWAKEDEVHSKLSNALWLMGMLTAGENRLAYLAEAAGLNEALLTQKPYDQDRQRSVALTEKYIAGDLLARAAADRAYEHLKRAGELDEERVKKSPNDPTAKLDWAIDLSQWGQYYELKTDFRKAIDFTQRSLGLRREIAATNPKDAWAQDRLAFILGRLGGLQMKTSPRQALSTFKEALAVGGEMQERAVSFAGVGAAHRKLGNEIASCAAYGEATKLYKELLKTPTNPYITSDAAEVEKASAQCSAH